MKMTDAKNDIKKMIQDHVKINSVTKEIDSPYAKYNSRGQLMCIVCGIPVKSKIIWQAHVNKRSHKENLTRLKEKQEKVFNILNIFLANFNIKNPTKKIKKDLYPRIASSKVKKIKNQHSKPKGILKNLGGYSSSEEETKVDDKKSIKLIDNNVKVEIKSELPDEFFDSDKNKLAVQDGSSEEGEVGDVKKDISKPSTSDALPEGFFDDPVEDAKARNVEYKDKNAEEWESFLKEVSQAEVESRQIIAEDKVESAIETQLEQANEQIKCLERIVELDKVKQNQLSEKKSKIEEMDEDESSDEEFLPVVWRKKNFI
ncbi:Zinc finger protein [Armadillidium nasatum]|uniref:Zinc finger protein 830 n=1 Tax=Armadillidium nasatum TaxID=96803 RepID=A0A5N5TFP2_9CRUS|nr:Zinc finger protein [Armadillidium nasatum]